MRLLVAISFALLPVSLAAQFGGAIDMSLPMANSQFILSQQIVTMSTPSLRNPDYLSSDNDDSSDSDDEPESSAPEPAPKAKISSLLVPTATAGGAAKLASNYPEAQRADAQRLFGELLSGHGKLMQQFGVAPNDMAGAVAAFIAGSHSAYNDRDIQEADFKLLVEQMRKELLTNPEFASATPTERRDAFEQLAILGMMGATVQMALKQNPQHPQIAQIRANLRKAGGDYLRGYLGVEPEKVEFGPGGLRIGA